MRKGSPHEKRFSILHEISSAIIVKDDIRAVTELMLDFAVRHTDAEKGSIMLADEGGELYILAARGLLDRFARRYRVKIGEGIAGRVAENRTAVLVTDIRSDPRFRAVSRDRYKTSSFISCPIISKEKLLGVLNVNDKKNGSPFTEAEFSFMKIIANQAAVALENAYLLSQLNARAGELEEINRRLVEADAVRTEFLSRISHELRTPLNSIRGAAYCMGMGEQEPAVLLEIIKNESERLWRTIELLLEFLRSRNEPGALRRTRFGLAPLFRELKRSPGPAHFDISPVLPEIEADRSRTLQLFRYISQALGDRAGAMRIAAGQEGDFVRIDITAEGILTGLNPAPFLPSGHFRPDITEGEIKIYFARKIAEAHGWPFEAESRSGFRITLFIPVPAP